MQILIYQKKKKKKKGYVLNERVAKSLAIRHE